jgi:hypothetical protein
MQVAAAAAAAVADEDGVQWWQRGGIQWRRQRFYGDGSGGYG